MKIYSQIFKGFYLFDPVTTKFPAINKGILLLKLPLPFVRLKSTETRSMDTILGHGKQLAIEGSLPTLQPETNSQHYYYRVE